jgi:hypothetical protein
MDVTRGSYVVSASLSGSRRAGAVREAVTGGRPLERLFTKEQRGFFAEHAPAEVDWEDLAPLGPVLVVLLKFVPEGAPEPLDDRAVALPGQPGPAGRAVDQGDATVLQVLADGVRFVREHGLSATGAQEPKTRKALEFFAVATPALVSPG